MRAKFYVYTLFLLALTSVLAGALRFTLAVAGKENLFYIPKFLVVLALGAEAFEVVRSGRTSNLTTGVVLLLATSGLVGLFTLNHVMQVVFGLYLLLPLLFAIVAQPAIAENPGLCGKLIGVLWVTAATGVVLAWITPMPWTGFSYDVGGVAMEASREWTTNGVARVAGFSRASYAAAYQLLFLALPIVMSWRRRLLALGMWIVTGALIVITTTKTTVGVYLALTILLPIMRWRIVPRGLKHAVAIVLPWFVTVMAIALPLSTLWFTYNFTLHGMQGVILSSFGDRLNQTWPDAFSLIARHGSYIFGRGAGGIGTAQSVYEPQLYNPSDNIFIFGYCTFGILFVPALALFVRRIAAVDLRASTQATLIWAMAVAALTAGWTGGNLEGGFNTLAIGLAAGYAFRTTSLHTSAPEPAALKLHHHRLRVARAPRSTVVGSPLKVKD